MNNFRQLRSFAATFVVLSADFVRDSPARNTVLALASLLIGLVYPVPIIGLLLATLSFAQGQSSVTRSLGGADISLPNMTVLLASVAALATIYVLRVVNGQAILARSRVWQKSLFSRLVGRTTELGRLDVVLPPLGVEEAGVLGWASRLAQAGTQTALLFVYGLNSVSIILVLTVILAVVSWPVLGVLGLSFLAMLPFYGTAMRGIRDTRARVMADRGEAQATLRAYARDLREAADPAAVPVPDDAAFASLQMVGFQHRHLLRLQMYAGLHVGVVLVALVALSGRLQLSLEQGALAVILCYFLLRTLVGFVQFLGQLVRNYENISLLRRWLAPAPPDPVARTGPLRVVANGAEHELSEGRATLLPEPVPDTLQATQALRARLLGSAEGVSEARPWTAGANPTRAVNVTDAQTWRRLDPAETSSGFWLVFGEVPDMDTRVDMLDEGDDGDEDGNALGVDGTVVRLSRRRVELPPGGVDMVGGAGPRTATHEFAKLRTVVLRELGQPQTLAFTARLHPDAGRASTPDRSPVPDRSRATLMFARGKAGRATPQDIYHRIPFELTADARRHSVTLPQSVLAEAKVATVFVRVEDPRSGWEIGGLRVEGPERTALFDRAQGAFLKHRFVDTGSLAQGR